MKMAAYVHVVDISPLTQHGYEARQGCRKQSVDGQAQLGVGGKDGNNSRAKRAAKFWIKLFLAVRRHCHCILQSLAILPKISRSTCHGRESNSLNSHVKSSVTGGNQTH